MKSSQKAETVEKVKKSTKNGTLYSFLVSLMALGFGFSLTSSTLVNHWECNTEKNLTKFHDSNLLTPEKCFTPKAFSFYTATIFLASLFSTLVSNFVNLKRKNLLLLANTFYVAGFIFHYKGMAHLGQAIISRILVGLATGLTLSVMGPFINDNSCEKIKGFLGVLASAFIAVGAFVTSMFGLINFKSVHGYSYVFVGYASFFLILCLSLFFCHDNEIRKSKKKVSFWKGIMENKKSLFVNVFLHLSQQLCLINGVFMFSDKAFTNSIKNKEWLQVKPEKGSVILSVTNVLGSLFSAALSVFFKKIGLYFFSHLSTMLCLIILGLQFQPAIFTCCFVFLFALGLGPLVWAIGPNLFEPNFVNTGVMIGNVVNMISSFCIPYYFNLVALRDGNTSFYYFGAGFLGVSFLVLGGLLKKEIFGPKRHNE